MQFPLPYLVQRENIEEVELNHIVCRINCCAFYDFAFKSKLFFWKHWGVLFGFYAFVISSCVTTKIPSSITDYLPGLHIKYEETPQEKHVYLN